MLPCGCAFLILSQCSIIPSRKLIILGQQWTEPCVDSWKHCLDWWQVKRCCHCGGAPLLSTCFLSYQWESGNCPYYSLLHLKNTQLYTQHTAQVCMNVSSSLFPSVGIPAWPRHVFFIALLVHVCRKDMGGSTPTESFPSLLFSCCENIAA